MSSRTVPLVALSVMLVVIFWAVVATAQAPAQPGQINGGQQQAGEQPQQPVQQQPQAAAQAPFMLSQQEEAVLDRLLTDWQQMSAGVKTFEAQFTRWDYDGVFGVQTPGEQPQAKRQVAGVLRYAAPDKGFYELADGSEKWICTGDAVFEFRTALKQVREFPLPPQMRGQAIADGPMPFVFGVQAAKMKARYWLRIVTPQDNQANQVWLEVFPKFARDAANFQKIYVVLSFAHENGTVTKLEPYALNMFMPNGKDRTVYQFGEMKTNTFLGNLQSFIGTFVRPSVPFGWQHQVEADPAPGDPQSRPQPGAAGLGGVPQQTVPR